jgi:tripartite-type tricarboxylate transporter receptor subunit TctC
MNLQHVMSGVVLAVTAALSAGAAQAAYPEKTVQYIIPFTPGGESDYVARMQSEVFRKKYNQSMVVQNRPGAGGGLVWAQLNSLPADGYTIAGVNLPHVVLQPLEGNVQYKTDDLAPVYFYHFTADAIVVPLSSPIKTFQDLIATAKAKPGALNFAGSGSFSANHMAHERLNKLAGIKSTYVPFKGTGDLLASVLGGHVDAAMTYLPFAIQQKSQTRLLAVASEQRHPLFPDVPKSTPPEIQKQVSDMMAGLNADPESRKKLADAGFDLVDVSLEKMPAFMEERKKGYLQDAKDAGLIK